ncbi:putative elongator complex protein 1 [Rachicladosporium monterosium]|uniref:Elongator complex protein 1 n=1 Tax=Rachicladosporium monterosium TaxID=1507873 RepID=A0ABR0LFK8_9PEZI|nr:putative elongator complex protein 1 [Rachicladosporium monterosium]
MTRDFEPTANITLSVEDLKVSSHVSVGWGKKETQFKGRGAAKALRDPTMPEHVDEGTLSPLDDKTANLSWRGDGQYFAMSSISDSEPACRIIRMYSREGVLESVSEPVNGLESGLSWKPSGQTIAGVRRSAEGLQVVFFERNGLRHGEFDLRLSKEESETIGRSVKLRWNIDSTVLAVALADRVQLWTVSNYHWYLRQEVYFHDARGLKHHADLLWHPERPLHMASFNDSELRLLDFAFMVSRGSVVPPNDHGLVAVIDGKLLKITPLRTANVPPPMAFDEIELPETANEAAFNRTGTGITVVHANKDVTKWEFDYSTKPVKRASLQEHFPHDKQSSPGTLAQRVDTLPNGDELSLSSTGVLGSRNQRIPGVTSYIMTPTHLIFTTSNHLLKFVHLEESCALQVPPDEPEKDERCRNIERGAKIVTVMPITAHVCKSPPDLEAGLTLISDLRKQQKQEQLEAAVEHICFLADVNQLYDTALGLYDLDVALLVAQQSQKDPREYLPYLQGLSDMQPLRQQYTIDDDLKRHHKALAHLHSLGEFEELKEYMAKHELYSASMDLHRYDSARLTELMRLFAAYLSSRNRYKEAGIAYEYVQDHSSAYEAYRSAGLWQECLASAGLVTVSDEELLELATNFVASLEEAKDYKAAATVQADYLADVEAAVRLLCKGYHFSEATRLASLHRKPELLRSAIDPGLVDGSASMTEMLAEMKSQLYAQVPRLRDLRVKKLEDPLAFIDGADGGDVDIPDNLSLAPTDASTTGTFMTRYTNRSTGTLATDVTRKTHKNRRREERKRARGKKGTVYEEEYLVNSIARLVERLNAVSEDVSRLVEGLMRRGMRERALAVDAAMQEVSELCRSSLDDVFVSTGESGNGTAEPKLGDEDARRPWGGQGVLWDALTTTEDRRDAPVLKVFERLSLLA